MSCRDVQRVVSDYCLFGEQDGLTAPHLEHLSNCRACRDEVGVDRALVRELRRALAERVEAAAPSAGVWQAVLRRAQQEPIEVGWRRWLHVGWRTLGGANPFMARVRTASVLSTMALAVLMANGQTSMPALPAASVSPPSEAWNQWERQVTLPGRIEVPLVRPIVRSVPATPPGVEEKVTRAPAPSRPTFHVSRDPSADFVETEQHASEADGDHPRLVWQLYPPTLDPSSDAEAPASDGGHSPPAVRSVPGEPS
jgi:hypothetical protein